tara:strand:- start:1854 stop:2234 length:381 start_codon:yes stop_codon:yes gene_type:complete
MKIKEIEIEKVREFAVDLLSKTYLELGQRPTEEDIVSFAVILAEDLKLDFQNLGLEDIEQAFRQGVRNTKEFHITVKVYYGWIKSHRKLIWSSQGVEPERLDKRLKYRTRKGTGISIIGKTIKKLK